LATKPRGWTGTRTPSALKRVRTTKRRTEVNGPRRSEAKTLVGKAVRVAAAGVVAETEQALLEALSALDRAAKAGAIHPNQAARRKSRLTRRINAALGGEHVQTSTKVTKSTGAAAAAKAAKARIAAGKAAKAKGAQTAAGKARAALSKTARAEAAAAAGKATEEAPSATKTAPKAPARASAPKAKAPARAKASAKADDKPAAKAPAKAKASAAKAPARKAAPKG
jgi:ribosomal protein S20